MECCKSNCIFASVIAAIVSGIILGVLYSLGFVATGIIFWAFLAIGVGTALLLPLYTIRGNCADGNRCVCSYRRTLTVASIGTIIAAAVGLIVPAFSIVVTSIIVGVATFFAVFTLFSALCFARCLSDC